MDIESIITEAGRQLKTIKFIYTKADGSSGGREAEPYSIKEKGNKSIFYGYDVSKEQIRAFDIANMSDASVTDNSFVARWPIEL